MNNKFAGTEWVTHSHNMRNSNERFQSLQITDVDVFIADIGLEAARILLNRALSVESGAAYIYISKRTPDIAQRHAEVERTLRARIAKWLSYHSHDPHPETNPAPGASSPADR